MGGRAEGLACADPGARTPIGASGNSDICYSIETLFMSTQGVLKEIQKVLGYFILLICVTLICFNSESYLALKFSNVTTTMKFRTGLPYT